MHDFGHVDNIRGTSDLFTQFSAPSSTLKLRPSHTSAALISPTARCGVGIITSQTSKESMYGHTTFVFDLFIIHIVSVNDNTSV